MVNRSLIKTYEFSQSRNKLKIKFNINESKEEH